MAGIEIDRLIYLILLLLMVAGWFFMQNRQSLNKTLQQAAIWGFIFLAVIAGIGLWEDITRTVSPQHSIVSGTGQVTIPRSIDGHYYLTAKVNDASVRFVVDTGATDIVLTQQDAERAGLAPDTLQYLGRAGTANGEVRTAFVRLDSMMLGDVTDRDVAAVVNGGEMDQSLLGMGYLQRWGRLEIAGGEMVLTR